MARYAQLEFLRQLAFAGALAALPVGAAAAEVWPGRIFGFTKPAFGNPSLPANQDRITPTVWITRGNSQGIFNIAQEASYIAAVSPRDTEWATGDAVNHASLSFQTWRDWTANNPPATVGVNAVVHLITEDIYIDIVFDAWGSAASGGSFAYRRGTPPATPTQTSSWGRIKLLFR